MMNTNITNARAELYKLASSCIKYNNSKLYTLQERTSHISRIFKRYSLRYPIYVRSSFRSWQLPYFRSDNCWYELLKFKSRHYSWFWKQRISWIWSNHPHRIWKLRKCICFFRKKRKYRYTDRGFWIFIRNSDWQ